MSEKMEPVKLTIDDIHSWIEQNAAPKDLIAIAGMAYTHLLLAIAQRKANAEELKGVWHALRHGWTVRFFHCVSDFTVSAEIARDSESRPLFEYDPRDHRP